MKRFGLVLLLALAALSGSIAAHAVSLPLFSACPVKPFVADTQLIASPGGHYLKVVFEVRSPISALIWGQGAYRQNADGFSTERSMVMVFLEDEFGNPIGRPGGFLAYPYGFEVTSPLTSATLPGPGVCGQAAAGSEYALQPGRFQAIVLAASESTSGHGLVLPPNVDVVRVERGPSATISEGTLKCDQRIRVHANGITSERLEGCEQTFDARGRAYRALSVGDFADPDHEVHWIDPTGNVLPPVLFFDIAVGAAGRWTLDVPRYVTPIAQPMLLPIDGTPGSDSGIFGAFADIPRTPVAISDPPCAFTPGSDPC